MKILSFWLCDWTYEYKPWILKVLFWPKYYGKTIKLTVSFKKMWCSPKKLSKRWSKIVIKSKILSFWLGLWTKEKTNQKVDQNYTKKLSWVVFTWCSLVFTTMWTTVNSNELQWTPMISSELQVNTRWKPYNFFCWCLPGVHLMFTGVHLCSLVFTGVHRCSLVFTCVHWCSGDC